MHARFGRRSGPVASVVAAFLAAAPAVCDEPPAVKVGDRVRVRVQGARKVGIVHSLDTKTLTLREAATPDDDTTFDLDSMQKVEISRGLSRGRNAGRGALIGGILGAIAGGIAASCANGGSECGGAWVLIGAGVAGGGGAMVGGLIGLGFPPSESWRPARVQRFEARLMPARGGAQVQMSFAF